LHKGNDIDTIEITSMVCSTQNFVLFFKMRSIPL
jgi:hypothetical protein